MIWWQLLLAGLGGFVVGVFVAWLFVLGYFLHEMAKPWSPN